MTFPFNDKTFCSGCFGFELLLKYWIFEGRLIHV
jgi:hypothetical protein